MERLRDLTTAQAPEDGRIRLTSRLLAGSFALLVVAVVLGLIVMPDPLDAIVAALLAIVVVSAAL
ncbi:MAG TPA: hypothetical protein VEY67_04700, partial [Candidatus Dormibacteraeota bacterium]|nr:hypothetical protein [Candidatus Dormibacteraeota bacterium]